MISCLRESLCFLPICLHPTEIIVYILCRKSRDKLSSRISVLFADLPTPNRNRCLHFISVVMWQVVFENRCALCRSAYTQPKSLFTFYIGSHVISCLRESLCYLPISLHPTEIIVNILYRRSRDKLSSRIAVLFADLPTPNRIVVYILYQKSRDKLSSRIAVLFANLPTPNRNRCLHFISEVTW